MNKRALIICLSACLIAPLNAYAKSFDLICIGKMEQEDGTPIGKNASSTLYKLDVENKTGSFFVGDIKIEGDLEVNPTHYKLYGDKFNTSIDRYTLNYIHWQKIALIGQTKTQGKCELPAPKI
ncbi:hypothetical protein [Thalassomonas actiniarum]|uniref:Uncharacterized protein n=1 Tax=Thalassomonas actiniarum TaxID=485447 RepID=A0AAE9YRH1_9GAMM|nr:hypothetical protein [Thalassomonas actiniarum]WDD99526.1 hypothetical protein SG35_002270 [Thalassomonas actiniarum]